MLRRWRRVGRRESRQAAGGLAVRAVSKLAFLLPGVMLLAVWVLSVPASAQPKKGTYWKSGSHGSGWSPSLHGDWLSRVGWVDDLELAGDGAVKEGGASVYERLRITPKLEIGRKLRLVSEADLVNGTVYGPESAVAEDYLLEPWRNVGPTDSAMLRKLYVEWDSPAGRLSLGQQAASWGLGLLANDGSRAGRFSDARGGDIVERAMLATRPLELFSDSEFAQSLYLALGADMVLTDDNADWMEGDEAWQAVAALFYRDDTLFAGFYAARRGQQDRDGTLYSAEEDGSSAIEAEIEGADLDVWALDAFFRVSGAGAGLTWMMAAEAAYVTGSTNRGTNENSPDSIDVQQWGAALEAELGIPEIRVATSLQAGYAGGDRNSVDHAATAFKFDPGYRVGMILFDDVLSGVSAYGADRLSDPAQKAVPPGGARFLPTNGSVTNAVYVAPTLTYAPVKPLEIAAGVVWAMAPERLVDPYLTQSVKGGVPTTPWGASADAWAQLGYEVDFGVEWTLPTGTGPRIALAAQSGAFLPGSAFEGDGGVGMGPLVKARTLLDVRW